MSSMSSKPALVSINGSAAPPSRKKIHSQVFRSPFDTSIMSYPTCEKIEMDGFPDHAKLPRQKLNNKWTKILATSLTILLLYLSVSTILNVQKIQTISNQVRTIEGSLARH